MSEEPRPLGSYIPTIDDENTDKRSGGSNQRNKDKCR